MKFALLGTDRESVALARAAQAAGHEVVWVGDIVGNDWQSEDLGAEWEALLDDSLAEAILVGRGQAATQLRCEQLNQLTKNGIACLTTYPLADSVLTYYEIDMCRGESGAMLHHFNPLVEQQAILERCENWIAQGHPQLGSIEQIVWERPLVERTQANVLRHFSRDVEFLSLVAGGLNRLGALGSPAEAATYTGLSVQLLGKSNVPVRWQVGPIEQDTQASLVLIAQQGKITVKFDEVGQATMLATSEQQKDAAVEALIEVDTAAQALQRFVHAIKSRDYSLSTWPRALQAMELTDTIEISLRRGRMIEVHQQQLTEELAFKGTMSAIGCGVLMVLPPLLLFIGWIAELMGLSLASYWPHALLGMLALFLGLQLIPKLIFGPDESSKK